MSLEKHNNHRIFGLDIVRALAIILVLFSHLYYLIDSSNPLLISVSGLFGFAGVEMFFVLSGFLIGTILLKMFVAEDFTTTHLFTFLKRRWFRTLPAYYLVLLINIGIGIYFSYDVSGWWKYFLFIQNLATYDIVIFTESWSLSIEEWAYVIAPLALFCGYRVFKRSKKAGFLVISLILILVFHLLRYHFYLNNVVSDMTAWNTMVKSLVIFRIDAIIIGFLVAWGHFYYQQLLQKYSVYLFIIAFHLFFLQFVVLNVLGVDIAVHPLYFIVFYFTFSSITIALGLPFFINWENGATVIRKPVEFVSKVSYSVYLLHYSVITVLLKQFFDVSGFSSGAVLLFVFCYLTIVFFLSFLLYRYFEKPMMDLRDRF